MKAEFIRKSILFAGMNEEERLRVLAYLNSVSLQKKSTEFDIPFDRQQLADYLDLERSALSKELGKMQREGLIKCRKNHFRLIETGK
ncbi:MAG: winged helix-turn-helix domain-containing protein [Selenomonas sp.]|nr:winged helix-turn-helix domain-containing protein [Selenomonas sp.]